MKTYDYKDETKDVRGKVISWLIIRLLDIIYSRKTFKLNENSYRLRDSMRSTSYSRCWATRRTWLLWSSLTLTRLCKWSRKTSSVPYPTWKRLTLVSLRQVLSRRMRSTQPGLIFKAFTNSSFNWWLTKQLMWSPLRFTWPLNSCKNSLNCSIPRNLSNATTLRISFISSTPR